MREATRPRIGVFDSGIGGLSILKALRAELPHADFIYIADSGHAPYGERDTAHVLARARAITAQLLSRHVHAVVIACNTATAAAIGQLRIDLPHLPFIGVEPACKPAARLSQTGHIGLLATRSTLASAPCQALLAMHAGGARGVRFSVQACDGLAHAIEDYAVTRNAIKVRALCAEYTRLVGSFGSQIGQIDTLVLGCTHYAFASEHLRTLVGPNVRIMDNSQAVARQTQRRLQALDGLDGEGLPMPAPSALGIRSPTEAAIENYPSEVDAVPHNDKTTEAGETALFTTGQPSVLQAAAWQWLGLTRTPETLSF